MGSCNDKRNSFWALDKWDKIGISIVLITFAIFSISSCFADYREIDYITRIDKLYYSASSGLTYNENGYVDIYAISPSTTSILVKYSGSYFNLGFFNDYPDSVEVSQISGSNYPSSTTEVDIAVPEGSNYLVVATNKTSPAEYSLYYDFEGISTVSLILSNFLNFNDLWSVFKLAVPYVLVVVLVSFGFYLIFHAIREISKGRDN